MMKSNKKITMSEESSLFQYIKPNNNDMFSEMKGLDLQDLLYYIEKYYLELRNDLGFHESVTFGMELEFEKAMQERIKKAFINLSVSPGWRLKNDSSLKDGIEITSPILKDTRDTWNELKLICSIVEGNAIIGNNSGGHIHIGTQVLGNKIESWMNFIKLWSVYENVIYRFVYGDFLTYRPSMSKYAKPIAQELWESYQALKTSQSTSFEDIIWRISDDRYQAVNFNNVYDLNHIENRNTIEFRCPNGSIDPVIWQNNVNLLVNILLYSKSSRYNDDIVTQRRNRNEDKYSDLEWYNEIYLQQALELCDMLFTNNFDKVYFLRQYLKSFETKTQPLSKPKSFTKEYKTQ